MPYTAASAYLQTRTAVMAGSIYPSEVLANLLERPIEELGKEIGLSNLIDNNLSQSATNRAIEKALVCLFMHDISILLRPMNPVQRSVLVAWARKFELYNLKALIRGKLNDFSYEQIRNDLYETPELISLPHEALLRTENIAELLRKLEQGIYSDIAVQARQVYEEKNEPFSLDATIDQKFYTSLYKRSQNAGSDDRDELLSLVKTLIDEQNLNWLLRYRLSYRLSSSETYYLLIPFGKLFHRERLTTLVNESTLSGIVDALPESLKPSFSSVSTIVEAENTIFVNTRSKVAHFLKHSKSALTRALAYLVLREINLRALYAIAQGKVLDLDINLVREGAKLDSPNRGEQNV